MGFVDRPIFRYLLVGLVFLQFQLAASVVQGQGQAPQRYPPQSNGYNGIGYGNSDFDGGVGTYERPYQAFNHWQGADPYAISARNTPQGIPATGYKFRNQPDIPVTGSTQPRFRPQAMSSGSSHRWGRGDRSLYQGATGPAPIFRPLEESELRVKPYVEQPRRALGNFYPTSTETFGAFRNQGDFRDSTGHRPMWDR